MTAAGILKIIGRIVGAAALVGWLAVLLIAIGRPDP